MDLNYNSYIDKYNGNQESKTKLVYGVDSSSPIIIDAVSGKSLSWNGEIIESVKTRNISDNQKEDIFKNPTNQNYMYMGPSAKRFISFNFGRVVNGVTFNTNAISYNNDGINVTLDCKTGEINSFGCMWRDKLDLPPAANTISNDEAKKVFLNTNKPQLTYLLFNNGNNMDKSNSKIQLVYYVGHNKPLNTIDAFTGKALNFFGENVDDNADVFKAKIKGSSVEKEALILASQGIIDTKDFKLDSGITRLQLVKVLVNAKGFNSYLRGIDDVSFTSGVGAKDSTDYRYVQLGVKYGIIEDKKDEFKGNELVTREELSKSLIKLLGYDRIAEAKGLLNLPYSDSNTISADKTGYVSLAGGLKVIEPNNEGKIRPKDNVTMSELIKAVYISLGTIQK